MTHDIPMAVAESPEFSAWADRVWTRGEKDAFVVFIARHPEVGDVVPGTGGFRKVRWRTQGRGKSGGVRVIYFFFDRDSPVYLLMGYAKTTKDNLTQTEKRALKQIATATKAALRGQRLQDND